MRLSAWLYCMQFFCTMDAIVADLNCEIGRIDIDNQNVYYDAKVIEKAWQLIEEARG